MGRRCLRCLTALAGAMLLALSWVACSTAAVDRRVEPTYDKGTGRLERLAVDTNGDGAIDSWSYMDGPRFIRIELDTNGDRIVDRWEYYGPDQKVEKVGFSRLNRGTPDAWAYQGADGRIDRVEVSTRGNDRISRTEYYEAGTLARAEEDTDDDGRTDKWERYKEGAVAAVAFDTKHRGAPDRRLVYGAHGSAVVEVDPDGTGHFVRAR